MRAGKRKCWAVIGVSLAVAAVLSVDATRVWAEGADDVVDGGSVQHVPYDIDVPVRDARGPIALPYVGENGSRQERAAGEWFDIATYGPDPLSLQEGWYFATESRCYDGRAVCKGHVRIVLCDGVTLNYFKGMEVAPGATLEIYGQSGQTGVLICDYEEGYGCAGIGGNESSDSGDIIIHGGRVEAKGGLRAAGIGGGSEGSARNIVVNRGEVVAEGGMSGAGIGGGWHGDLQLFLVEHQSEIEAKGGSLAAGIGGGYEGACERVHICNGTIRATGGTHGAGIGGGDKGDCNGCSIEGANVEATGGDDAAGIGGGYCGDNAMDVSKDSSLDIFGSHVVARGNGHGAAIGGGGKGRGGTVCIMGSDIAATSSMGDAIGGGAWGYGCSLINILSSTCAATSEGASGIGADSLRANDSTIKAVAGAGGTAIGGSFEQGNEPSAEAFAELRAMAKADVRYGYLSFGGNMMVDASSSAGAAIGRGFIGGDVCEISFGDGLKVTALDDAGEHLARDADRRECCVNNRHVKISSEGL